MVYELKDTAKAERLFAGWQETLITSCLQRVMGKICVTDESAPRSAFAYVGCFGFFDGEPSAELVKSVPEGFSILTPPNRPWAELIEVIYPEAEKTIRYAIRKDTHFDVPALKNNLLLLPEGYELRQIDAELYDRCLENPATADFVSSFADKEAYLRDGRGVVIVKNGEIVSGASSYTRYKEGIELEVDTVEAERRKHLALVSCSALILNCLEEGLYPSWDAQNWDSVRLAEKLGYEFDHEYTVYELEKTKGTPA